MKLLLYLSAILGHFTLLGAAYGPAGASERIMYFAAYQLEEIMGGDYKIAQGCVGVSGGRCNFNEFLSYIWDSFPEKGDTKRPPPDMNLLPAKVDFAKAKLATLLQNINGYKRAKLPKAITGNIASGRLYPGAVDYYDAMVKCGERVQDARAFYETMPAPDDEDTAAKDKKLLTSNLIGRAAEASKMTCDIRAKEMDHNEFHPRLQELETKLGFPLTTVPGRDATGQVVSKPLFDPAGSIRDNPDKKAEIIKAVQDWIADPADNESNLRHMTALNSARLAESHCGC